MIPLARPLLGEEEKEAVCRVLESGILAQGQNVKDFEQQFAEFIGVKHAIATSNGTTALHAALLAHGIGAGDEVITTPFTFIAAANMIREVGAVPVFVDIDETTFNLNPALIEQAITPQTKAILPVHLFGQSCDMGNIMALAGRHNLIVIEDACQAHGASDGGKNAGSFATGCFSFYPTKNMTTGEGGMITTNDSILAGTLRKLISHGQEQRYYHDQRGFNFRMTNIAAALGQVQLKKLPEFTRVRQNNAAVLYHKLQGLPGIILPSLNPGHVYHQFTIRITSESGRTREDVAKHLAQQGIETAIFYPLPIHQQKSFVDYRHLSFPCAEKAAREVLSLPVHPALQEEELAAIARALRQSVSQAF